MKKYTPISLKKLTEKYGTTDILLEANKKYTLFSEDALSLMDLIKTIRNSPDGDNSDMDIVLMVAFLGEGKRPDSISYSGFKKNNRHYRFTAKNCCNIEKISHYNVDVQTIDEMKLSDPLYDHKYLPKTELELLVVILLSINAFSPEVVDSYFDGEVENANPIAYILELINNNDSPIAKKW